MAQPIENVGSGRMWTLTAGRGGVATSPRPHHPTQVCSFEVATPTCNPPAFISTKKDFCDWFALTIARADVNVSAALSNRLLSNDLKALFPGVNAIMQAKMSLEIATAYKAKRRHRWNHQVQWNFVFACIMQNISSMQMDKQNQNQEANIEPVYKCVL